MEQRPKIIVFSAFFDPWMSGAELFVKEVVERLGDRYHFVILTARISRSVPAFENRGKYEIRRLGFGLWLDKWAYPLLAATVAARLDAKLAHAVMESYAGIALWLFGLLKPGVKRVLTLQSGDLDSEKKQARIPGWLWKKIHTSPHMITAISKFLADRAVKLGVDQNKVTVIPNGVDLERLVVRGQAERVPHRLVTVARLSWEKGLSDLFKALALVRKDIADARLVLVGDGPLRQTLEKEVQELNLQDAVDFRGALAHEQAMAELRKADVFVLPSLAEGLGIVFIEAQALGVPAIGTNVGGIPDVIENEITGLLVAPSKPEELAAAIKRLMQDRVLADRLAQEARRRIEKFSWTSVAESVARVYEKLSV